MIKYRYSALAECTRRCATVPVHSRLGSDSLHSRTRRAPLLLVADFDVASKAAGADDARTRFARRDARRVEAVSAQRLWRVAGLLRVHRRAAVHAHLRALYGAALAYLAGSVFRAHAAVDARRHCTEQTSGRPTGVKADGRSAFAVACRHKVIKRPSPDDNDDAGFALQRAFESYIGLARAHPSATVECVQQAAVRTSATSPARSLGCQCTTV